MFYLDILIYFIIIPLIFFTIIFFRYRNNYPSDLYRARSPFVYILSLALIALFYTTPWDNYLVANSIWFYSVNNIQNIIIGYVPLEEYLFFIIQTFFTSSILLLVLLFKGKDNLKKNKQFKYQKVILFSFLAVWLFSLLNFFSNNQNSLYLSLILLWFILPIITQIIYGYEILLEYKYTLLITVTGSTLYLAIIDSLAIFDGIWTISPSTSLNLLILGILPIEEFIFFLVTNILVSFALVLFLSSKSHHKFNSLRAWIKGHI